MSLETSLSNSLAKKKKKKRFIGLWKETVSFHVQEFTINTKYFCFEYLSAAVPWSLLIVIIMRIFLYIQMIVSLDPQLWWNICLGSYSRGLSFKDEYLKGTKTSTIPLRSWIKHVALLLAETQWIFLCVFHSYNFTFFA